MIPLPEGNSAQCDMLDGPCACGAWHTVDDTLWRLAREYHERTEWFDQAYCRFRDEDGIAMPEGIEASECNRHAWRVHNELEERCRAMGVNPRRLTEAIRADVDSFLTDWRAGKRHIVTPDPAAAPIPEGSP